MEDINFEDKQDGQESLESQITLPAAQAKYELTYMYKNAGFVLLKEMWRLSFIEDGTGPTEVNLYDVTFNGDL